MRNEVAQHGQPQKGEQQSEAGDMIRKQFGEERFEEVIEQRNEPHDNENGDRNGHDEQQPLQEIPERTSYKILHGLW